MWPDVNFWSLDYLAFLISGCLPGGTHGNLGCLCDRLLSCSAVPHLPFSLVIFVQIWQELWARCGEVDGSQRQVAIGKVHQLHGSNALGFFVYLLGDDLNFGKSSFCGRPEWGRTGTGQSHPPRTKWRFCSPRRRGIRHGITAVLEEGGGGQRRVRFRSSPLAIPLPVPSPSPAGEKQKRAHIWKHELWGQV